MNVPHTNVPVLALAVRAFFNHKTLTFVTTTQYVPYLRANDHQFVCECVGCGALDSCYESEDDEHVLTVYPVCWACYTGDAGLRYGSEFRGGFAETKGLNR